MSKYFIEKTTLTAIGDAVRAKAGTTDLIKVSELATAIANIPTGEGGGGGSAESIDFAKLQKLQVTNSSTSTSQDSIDISNYISSLDQIEFAVWQGFGATTQSTKYPASIIYIPCLFGDKLIVFDFNGSSSQYLGYNVPDLVAVGGISSYSGPNTHKVLLENGSIRVRTVYDDGTESANLAGILCARGTFTCWYKEV